jgi:hypothetical protein
MSEWNGVIPTDGTVDLPPDPRALDALGRNHSLPTALADLVDNAIDASAANVLIRFVQRGPALLGLYVVDDGHGIGPDQIDTAMTVGGRRQYGSNDLGLFGLGLKAASFSQAASLTVLSQASGQPPVGRRWLLHPDRNSFHCDKVQPAFVAEQLNRKWPFPLSDHGTVVRWDHVHGFPNFDQVEQTAEFLSRTIAGLQGHLGLMFHRIIASGTTSISIDVEDIDEGVGPLHRVTPLDPFGYPAAPPGWPKTLVADVSGTRLELRCHLWPRRCNLPEYRLTGDPEQRQGLYFYRHDRLLHAGGWEGVHAPDRTLQLARVEINIEGDLARMFTLNAEKSRVNVGPEFARAVRKARAEDGTTIDDYLRAAQELWTRTNQRTGTRHAVVPPGRGIEPRVAREIRDELPQLQQAPLNILWRHFTNDVFFVVDRENATLWLNQKYRQALLGGRRGGLNDLPVLKALLYLLTEQVFQGNHLGPRDKDNIDLWQEILTAAARTERAVFEARR